MEGRLYGWISSLESEWLEPHVGFSSPRVQHRQAHLVGRLMGLTGGLCVRSLDSICEECAMLTYSREEGAD